MILSLTILIISISLIPLKIGLFEGTFALILSTQVLAYLIGIFNAPNFDTYLISFVILTGLLYGTAYKSRNQRNFNLTEEILPIVIFIVAFNFLHYLTLKWADFVSIGERLRDYAILSSVIHSPVDVKEPWLTGYPLNYYAFWYRFGHMLSSVFGLKTWNVYHILQSFTYALYFTCGYRLLNKYLKVNKAYSIFFSVILCFGSNLAGIKDFVFDEPGWWGPSRVIPGAIDEFPAWSFLLGDLHPHYLNLPLLPFFLIFLSYAFINIKNPLNYFLLFIAAAIPCTLWISNSNVWDVPVWLLLISVFSGFYLLEFIKYLIFRKEGPKPKFKLEISSFLALVPVLLLSISLYLSRKNIVTPNYPVDFVKNPIPRTSLHDFCLHFGLPLFIITTGLIFEIKGNVLRFTSVLLALYFYFFNEALPLLVILIFIILIKDNFAYKIFSRDASDITFGQLLTEATGIFSLAVLTVPEIIFLNDPYGAEIERMNTIFKIYSVAWFFIHIYAFSYLSKFFSIIQAFCLDLKSKKLRLAASSAGILFIAIPFFMFSTGFFFTTIEEREIKNQDIKPIERGLSEINRLYPGAADTIKTLYEQPDGVILEAQGKPYDYTTMIATLSEKPSYVGWVNHVNLLLNNIPEIGRREKMSENFYREKDCNKKIEMLKNENIRYVIYGPLEQSRYSGISPEDFTCLNLLFQKQSFRVYSYDTGGH